MLNVKQDPTAGNSSSQRKNHLIMASSAYYQFNHLYKKFQLYQEYTDPNSPLYDSSYGLFTFTIDDMPDGWNDIKVIQHAKNTMTELQFLMEYKCLFPPDSDGFYPASLIEGARKMAVVCQKEGEKGAKYVLGIDPARSGDNFALCVVKLGPPNRVVAMYSLNRHTFPQMHEFIRYIIRSYEKNGGEIVRIQMDNGGGGQTLKDLLAEPYGYFENGTLKDMPPILDFEDEEQQYISGKRILKMQVFSPQSINSMNFDLRADMEKGQIMLPKVPPSHDPDLETIFKEIEKAIEETMTIVTTPLKSGFMHFDTPKTRMKKDRYSALLLAGEGARDYTRILTEPPKPKLALGFIGGAWFRR